MFLFRITELLDTAKVEYAIAGGFALALHGAVRGTVDVDLVVVISQKNLEALERALKSAGFQSRIPITASEIYAFRKEYIEKRNLIAWNFFNPHDPSELVDIIITHDLRKMKISRIPSGKRMLKVISKKDLIAMKRASNRPQDVEDIRALESLKS